MDEHKKFDSGFHCAEYDMRRGKVRLGKSSKEETREAPSQYLCVNYRNPPAAPVRTLEVEELMDGGGANFLFDGE